MDKSLQIEALDRQSAARRRFLTQAAATGAAAAMPALAQEESGKSSAPAATSSQGSIAETLAQYATTLKYEDLPPEIVRMTKRIIIDTLGCAIGAYSAKPSQMPRALHPRKPTGVSAKSCCAISRSRSNPDRANRSASNIIAGTGRIR